MIAKEGEYTGSREVERRVIFKGWNLNFESGPLEISELLAFPQHSPQCLDQDWERCVESKKVMDISSSFLDFAFTT